MRTRAVFGALAALVLAAVGYNDWRNQPGVLAAPFLAEARAALARGNAAAADQALKQAAAQAPALAAEFARDQAALYRELARRAQAAGQADKAALALAEVQRWEQATGAAPAKAEDQPALALAAKAEPKPADKRPAPVGPIEQEMVQIPAGTFQMGCSPGDGQCGGEEKPAHPVQVRAFRMGKYEVTQAQWRAVMDGVNPSKFKGDDRPVENVSWGDIQGFLKRLNAGNLGIPYRLPTEAEWEYAARGGTQGPYWWGKDIGKGKANCDGCGSQWDSQWDRRQTAPVGSFPANPFGLYDTAGNVWESVADCWHGDYKGAPADGSEWQAACQGAGRVVRGSSWNDQASNARVSNRNRNEPARRNANYGLRLAQDL